MYVLYGEKDGARRLIGKYGDIDEAVQAMDAYFAEKGNDETLVLVREEGN